MILKVAKFLKLDKRLYVVSFTERCADVNRADPVLFVSLATETDNMMKLIETLTILIFLMSYYLPLWLCFTL